MIYSVWGCCSTGEDNLAIHFTRFADILFFCLGGGVIESLETLLFFFFFVIGAVMYPSIRQPLSTLKEFKNYNDILN